jgi:medium-chain acyl-[acyl-carrier-protein] hydrolase
MTYTSEWLWFPVRRPMASLRLVCIPYAGGGAGIFRSWPVSFPYAEVAVVRLPGRERRFNQAPFRDFGKLLDALAAELTPLRDRPLALFGHSMGALLAFELARLMSANSGPDPVKLFVSGCRAPDLFSIRTSQFSDAEFIDHLRTFRLLPEAANPQTDLLKLMLPTVRADFAAAESYRYQPGPLLRCAVHAYCGANDPHVVEQTMALWREQTSGAFTLEFMPGGHFFLHSAEEQMLRRIDARLRDHAYR